MDDKRNLILAMVLASLILFGWPFIQERFFPAANPPVTKVEGGKTKPLADPSVPAAGRAAAVKDRTVALREGPRVMIDAPKIKGSINLKGARFDDIVLPTYKETIAKNSAPVRLFSPSGTSDAYFAGFGWSGQGVKAPDGNTLWTASGTKLTPQTPVTLSWDNGAGQLFQIKLSIDDQYMFTVAQSVTNRATGAVAVAPYGYVSRDGVSKDPDSWTIQVGPVGVFDGKANYDVDYKDLDKTSPEKFTSTGGWLGFTDKYWLAALIPDQKTAFDASFRKGGATQYQADFAEKPSVVAPGRTAATQSKLFVGAKEIYTLEGYSNSGAQMLDFAIDWGWFRWFEKPIFYLLHWLFEMTRNFGVAIILLTFIVRGIMFPVAQRQFASMAAMRAIQPKMKALQEKHKDDKAKQQQAIMELYRQEKVNPLAGCLPIFLQIPVFFALYKVLMLSIEMRHQPFVLWIKDLSAPDPLHILNLFGLLPFTPPSFLGIGVLAILLGISMWLQFRLNPAPMDEAQKQIFAIMPWMMMFVMAPFAAGLLIYWITSNMLTIAQQSWLYSRHPALKVAPAK